MSRTLGSATTRPAARQSAESCSVESVEALKARGVVAVTKMQMAAAIQVTERTVTAMIQRREIPFFRIGNKLVRIRIEEAIKRMEARTEVAR